MYCIYIIDKGQFLCVCVYVCIYIWQYRKLRKLFAGFTYFLKYLIRVTY